MPQQDRAMHRRKLRPPAAGCKKRALHTARMEVRPASSRPLREQAPPRMRRHSREQTTRRCERIGSRTSNVLPPRWFESRGLLKPWLPEMSERPRNRKRNRREAGCTRERRRGRPGIRMQPPGEGSGVFSVSVYSWGGSRMLRVSGIAGIQLNKLLPDNHGFTHFTTIEVITQAG